MPDALDYRARYAHPNAVVEDASLTSEQQRAILDQWRLDEQRRQTSRAEGLQGGPAPRLDEVEAALRALDARG